LLRWDPDLSPVRQAVFLWRIDPERHAARYSLVIERNLFGWVVLIRNWGRIGTRGRELVEERESEEHALKAMQTLVERKRRRGYEDL
jgi:predicted DNA-binding WGR domain protein